MPEYDLDWVERNTIPETGHLYDYVGRTETMQMDMDIICEKIGISKIKLPHVNKTKHKHYTEYYTDETRELVANWHKIDIDYFGFKFEKEPVEHDHYTG